MSEQGPADTVHYYFWLDNNAVFTVFYTPPERAIGPGSMFINYFVFDITLS